MHLDALFDAFSKGGVMMIVLIGVSFYVVSIIVFKLLQYRRLGVFDQNALREIFEAVQQKNFSDATRIAANSKSISARVAECALWVVTQKKLSSEQRMQAVEAVTSGLLTTLERHMRGLELAANLSPLIGLTGTVLGMIRAFARIEEAGARVDPGALAGGIWEALITTVTGLAIAIPALVAYTSLEGVIERWRNRMRETVYTIFSRYDA